MSLRMLLSSDCSLLFEWTRTSLGVFNPTWNRDNLGTMQACLSCEVLSHVKNCSAKEQHCEFHSTNRDGLALVENVALSDGNYPEEYDRSDRGDSSVNDEKHKKEIKTLNDKLDKILTGQQKQVHFVCEDDVNQEGEDQQTEEVCYMSNQGGYYKGYNTNNNTNLSYRSTNVENPQDQVYPPQQNQNQGGQQTVYFKRGYPPKVFGIRTKAQLKLKQGATQLAEINNKVDCSYNDLNKKLESLNSKVQHLEAKSHNIPSSSKGMLPGKAIANPKEYVQAITLKSGRVLPERVVPSRRNEDVAIQEEEESVDIEAEES
ncbi:unnamed protein product [Microthlaspi erraticum]|uniref:Uncharacterized protein n=1 Tax=Microthlaspi erraticum TaxID=1685480 RepID=A0A6D2JHT1_9BRAS|nr:unnamed protein product [Microthlaspi erraticum]